MCTLSLSRSYMELLIESTLQRLPSLVAVADLGRGHHVHPARATIPVMGSCCAVHKIPKERKFLDSSQSDRPQVKLVMI